MLFIHFYSPVGFISPVPAPNVFGYHFRRDPPYDPINRSFSASQGNLSGVSEVALRRAKLLDIEQRF